MIITDPVLPYEEIGRICISRNIKMLQLREKDRSDRHCLDTARRLRKVTGAGNTCLIINDRADIASLSGAGRLHLGQDDISLEDAKGLLADKSRDMLFGLSTHSAKQAEAAIKLNPDYLGFGPVFPTNAKKKPDPPVGLDALHHVVNLSPVPVVAIGGIFPENIESVLEAGARNVCMVRYFMQSDEMENRIAKTQKIMERYI